MITERFAQSFARCAVVLAFLAGVALATTLPIGPLTEAWSSENPEDSTPMISITRNSSDRLTEGESAVFTLESTAAPADALAISVFVSETEDYVLGNPAYSVILPSGQTSVNFSVQTDDDQVDEHNGRISAEIEPGDGYTVDSGQQASAVEVLDNDIATLTVTAISKVASMEMRSRFLVQSSIVSTRDLEIRLTDNRGFFAEGGTTTKILRAGMTELNADVHVSHSHLETFGSDAFPNGRLDYRIVPNSWHPDHYRLDPETSFASIPLSRELLDLEKSRETPILTIRRNVQTDQLEDEKLWLFVESINDVPTEKLKVNLEIQEVGGNYLARGVRDGVTLPKGHWKQYFTIDLNDDNTVEDPAWINVRILPGNGYVPAESPDDRYSVKVLDDDSNRWQVGIERSSSYTVEGRSAIFYIISTQKNTNGCLNNINLEVSETGNFLKWTPPSSIGICKNSDWRRNEHAFSTINLPTVDDSTVETDGLVEVAILPGAGYDVDPMKNRDSMEIRDNDAMSSLPEISVSQSVTSGSDTPPENLGAAVDKTSVFTIQEGGTARIHLYTSDPLSSTLDVNLSISQTGEFLSDSSSPLRINFPANHTHVSFAVNTLDDNIFEGEGTVRATVLPGQGYSVSDAPNDSVRFGVLDNDEVPVVKFSTVETEVTAGSNAKIWFRTQNPSKNDIRIQFGYYAWSFVVSALEYKQDNWHVKTDSGFIHTGPFYADLPAGSTETSYDLPIPSESLLTGISDDNPNYSGALGYVLVKFSLFTDFSVTESGYLPYEFQRDLILEILPEGDSSNQTAVSEAEIPVVSIVAARYPLLHASEDSREIRFKVTANPVPTSPIEINLNVSEERDYLLNGSGDDSVVMEADKDSVIYTLALEDDEVDEKIGSVSVTVMEGEGYEPTTLQHHRTATGHVQDDDIPLITISGGESIIEGQNAEFTLTADRPIGSGWLSVGISLDDDEAGFLGDHTKIRVPMEYGDTTKTFSVPTIADRMSGESGTLTATVAIWATYVLPDVEGVFRAQVRVFNDDDNLAMPPEISISASAASVVEGSPATFTITASDVVESALDVLLSVRMIHNESDVTSTTTVTIPADSRSITHNITAPNDGFFGTDASVSVSIVASFSFGDELYTVSQAAGSATVSVDEDETTVTPVVSLYTKETDSLPWAGVITVISEPIFPGSRVHPRGHYARVESRINYRITYTRSDGTIYVVDDFNTWRAVYPEYEEGNFQLSLVENDVIRAKITLLPGSGYTVSPTSNVGIIDLFNIRSSSSSEIPSVSIRNYNQWSGDTITSDFQSCYNFWAIPKPPGDMLFNYSIGKDSEPAEMHSQFSRLMHRGFEGKMGVCLFHSPGTYTVRVLPGTGYEVDPNSSSYTINVVAPGVEPEIWIQALDQKVTEGEHAGFKVNFSPKTPGMQTVNLIVSDTGNFLPPNYTHTSMRLNPSQLLRVPTLDNSTTGNGSITVTLGSGTGYSLADGRSHSATVIVEDNDLPTIPEISIVAKSEPKIEEGEIARFKLKLTEAVSSELVVNVRLTQTGEFLAKSERIRTVRVAPDRFGKKFKEFTVNDSEFEAKGSITATVLEGAGYTVASEPDNSAKVRVIDNDRHPPEISIVAKSETIIEEGEKAIFKLNLSETVSTEIAVNVNLSHSGDFFTKPERIRTVTVSSDKLRKKFREHTVDDAQDESDGSVTATIMPGTGYTVASAPDNSVTVSVTDNDPRQLPVISITSASSSVSEGSQATFTVSTQNSVDSAVDVTLSISKESNDNDEIYQEVATIPSGSRSITHRIAAPDDDLFGTSASLSVSLVADDSYTVNESAGSATVTVVEDETTPLVSVQTITESVVEGGILWYLVSADTASFNRMSVNVSFTGDTEGFLATDVPEAADIWAGFKAVYLRVQTVDDETDEENGLVTVALAQGTGYEVDSTRASSSATVQDDDEAIPVVSIESDVGPSIPEGGRATFAVTFDIPSTEVISINTLTTQSGNYFSFEALGSHIMGSSSMALPVSYVSSDNELDEPDGSITVEILAGDGYAVADSPHNTASIAVTDNDLPPEDPSLSITAVAGSIDEGGTAEFGISTEEAVKSDLSILVTIEMNGESTSDTVKMDAGEHEVSLPVTTMDDEMFGPDTSVRVTLLNGIGYEVDSAKKSAAVTVRENDSEPEISVETITPTVTEGSPVWLMFRSTVASKTDLTVNVSISESVGSYLRDDAPETVEILAYHRLAVVSLETLDDDIAEGDGSIDLAIRDGNGYGVDTDDSTVSVNVLDNDHSDPEVSAGNIFGSMEEGGIAIFRVEASASPVNDITVNLEVSEEGEFISGQTPDSVEIAKFNTIGLILVRTDDDETDEQDGSITLEILEGTGYDVASGSGGSSTVEVLDNDFPARAPVVSISAVSSAVVEGNEAEFYILSLKPMDSDTFVRVRVATEGDFFGEDTGGLLLVELEADTSIKQFSIPTVGDDREETDGSIVAVIEADTESPATYSVVESYSSSSVNVTDDDDMTEISIVSVTAQIEESDTVPAKFTITSTKTLLNDLEISVDVQETGSVISGDAPESVTLPAGEETVALDVPLSDDETNEAQSRITATLGLSASYNIAESPGNSAYVDVTDNDQFVLRAGMHMDGRRAPWDEYTGALPIEGLPMILYFNTEEPYGTEVNRDITVNFAATDTQGKLISPPTTAVIKAGKARSGEVLLPTSCNEAREPVSTITVRVLPGDGYVSQGDGTFTATLNDIEIGSEGKNTCPGPRVMSISSDRSEITEGGSFTLTITPDGHNNGTYSVFVDIENEVGNFVADTKRREIEFKDGSKQNKQLTITAQENNDHEETGVIMVSIVDTDDSVGGPSDTVRVNVLDNDPDVTAGRVVPKATISSVASEIEEGGTAEFTVSLDSDAKSVLTVNVAWTVEGDYLNAGTGTVTVAKDGREGELSLETKGDDDIKADGSVTAIIKPGEGYDLDLKDLGSISARITILDNDAKPSPARSEALHRSVLPDLLGESSERTVNAVSSRIDFAFHNAGQTGFELAGASTLEDLVKHSGQLINEGDADLTRILSNSSFALPMIPDGESGLAATLWGSGFNRNVSDIGGESSIDWNGESFTGLLGFDAKLGDDLLAGMAASSNESSVDFRHEDREGVLEGLYRVRMTSLQPYFGWSNDDLSTQLRASAGFGLGEVEIDYDRYDSETSDSLQYSMLLGGTDRLYSSESLFGGSSKLTLNAEAWTARQFVEGNGEAIVGTSVDTRSLRIMADGTLEKQLESGSAFNPALSIGTRWDGGDDRQGLGIEFSGGAGYENPFGLAISSSGRMLTADGFSKYERGLKGELSYDSGNDGIGLVTSLSPAWGVVDGNGVQQLWNDGVKESDSLGNSDGLRLGTEIGYGFGILDGRLMLTPFASTELNEGGRNMYGVGSRLGSGSRMSLEMKGTYDSTSTGIADRKVRLEGSLDW